MEVYNTPQNKFVASFIGSPEMNFIKQIDGTEIGVRPEHLYIKKLAPKMVKPVEIRGVVSVIETLGAETLITVTSNGQDITAKLPGLVKLSAGTKITLAYDIDKAHVFEEEHTIK